MAMITTGVTLNYVVVIIVFDVLILQILMLQFGGGVREWGAVSVCALVAAVAVAAAG